MAIPNFLKKFKRKRGGLGDVEEAVTDDGFEWDNKDIMPYMGDSFPAFPQQRNDRDSGGGEGGEQQGRGSRRREEAEMWDAVDLEEETIPSFWTSTESAGSLRRPVLTSEKHWQLSIKHRLTVTTIMLLAAVAAFFPMLLLPMGAGQGAWPISDNVTCHSDHASYYERFLRMGKAVARVAIIPLVVGVVGALVLNTLQLFALWSRPLLSAIVCYATAFIYVVYMAVMPYKCAASSSTATLSFCFPFLQFFVLLVVPLLQKEDVEEDPRKKEEAVRKTYEEEERLREARSLLDPAVCRMYYKSTWLPENLD